MTPGSSGRGLRVRTEDIARFGQLFLQKGMWNGRQVVPADERERLVKALMSARRAVAAGRRAGHDADAIALLEQPAMASKLGDGGMTDRLTLVRVKDLA